MESSAEWHGDITAKYHHKMILKAQEARLQQCMTSRKKTNRHSQCVETVSTDQTTSGHAPEIRC